MGSYVHSVFNGTLQTKNRTLEAHKNYFVNYLIFSTGLGIFTYKNLEDIYVFGTLHFFLFFILYSWLYYLFSPDSSGSYLRLTWYLIIYLLITRRAEKQEQRCSFSFTFRCRIISRYKISTLGYVQLRFLLDAKY